MAGKTRGPKFKLSKDLVTRFTYLLGLGIPSGEACTGAGITRETLSDYRRRAREGEPKFVEFAEATDKAIADGRIRLLMQIRKHGAKDFRAPAWILEHAHASQYGTKAQLQIDIGEERRYFLNIAHKALDAASYTKLLKAITASDVARDSTGRTSED